MIYFILYLLAHDPFIIFKTYYQIFTKIDGFFNKLYYLAGWTLFGFLYLIFVNLIDTCMLINILCLEKGRQSEQVEEERTKSQKMTFYINKNVLLAMKQLKEIGDSQYILFHKQQNLQRIHT